MLQMSAFVNCLMYGINCQVKRRNIHCQIISDETLTIIINSYQQQWDKFATKVMDIDMRQPDILLCWNRQVTLGSLLLACRCKF